MKRQRFYTAEALEVRKKEHFTAETQRTAEDRRE